MKQIKASRNSMVPSFTLYIEDIMLFTKGNISSLDAIAKPFQQYADFSGQVCNPSKSILYEFKPSFN